MPTKNENELPEAKLYYVSLPGRSEIMPVEWTPAELKAFRLKLGLDQRYIADLFGVSQTTISHLETYKIRNPLATQMYGTILERIYAYQLGYIPAYRKIGESEFLSDSTNLIMGAEIKNE